MSEEQRIEQMASAVEDLIYMGVISLDRTKDEGKALLSPQFSRIASNLLPEVKVTENSKDKVMNLMYYTLLIYMNENMRIPKPLTMALGNDFEKNRNNMESGELMTNYVSVLAGIWLQNATTK